MLPRLTRLGQVTGILAAADDLETVIDIVTGHAADVAGATAAMLALLDGDELRPLGVRGEPLHPALTRSHFSVGEDAPICEVVRTGAPVVVMGADAVAARYPYLASDTERSLVAFPLRVGDAPAFGGLALRFDGEGSMPDPQEIALLHVIADICTQTVLRIEAQRQSAERARKLEFLSQASEALASSLDHRETLKRVARLAVPDFADWCSVRLLEDGRLANLVLAHVDPAKEDLVLRMTELVPHRKDADYGSEHVARSGVTQLLSPMTDELLRAATSTEAQFDIGRELGLTSVLVVPLLVRGVVTGVMTFASTRPERLYSSEDVSFAEDLARRAALAIDNADLFSQTHRAAQELQRALLPQGLPQVPGWQLGSVYRQAGRADIGGDFYDVFVLPDGRLAAVIGDVTGRGVDAAAAGAQLHFAVRALVAADPAPESVAAGLDRLLDLSGELPLVTVAYLLFDPTRDGVEILVAGHLPPLLVGVDGVMRWMSGAGSPAFGVGPVQRHAERGAFGPGDLMVLYTDGLVERRGEDLETGLERLRLTVREAETDPGGQCDLDAFLGLVVDRTRDTERDDDIAVLALRRLS